MGMKLQDCKSDLSNCSIDPITHAWVQKWQAQMFSTVTGKKVASSQAAVQTSHQSCLCAKKAYGQRVAVTLE